MVKQEIYTIIKNPYFKLLTNNITYFTLENIFLEKIKSNIKTNRLFLYFLIKKTYSIKKVNAINSDKNMFNTIFLIIKNRKDHLFSHS